MLRPTGPLVSVDWLAANLTDPGLRIADVRWSLAGPPGRERYADGHLPGAVFLDADRELSSPEGPGRHPVPTAAKLARVLGRAGVAAMLGGETLLLDARAAERYRGETEPVDPRAGHIPGAVSAPFAANLAPDGCFLPPDALRARYDSLGAGQRPVVAYCGSSLSATHDLLALTLAGFSGARLYEGSWSDWSSDPARPAAVGPGP
jgi:thiosulfate/3-mercaptopyruvate sulfurtransferase